MKQALRRVALLPCLLFGAHAIAQTAPRPLQCLQRFYGVKPERSGNDGAWRATLENGASLPWDDGREKTFDQKLAGADLEDMFSIPYEPGPIRAVTRENEDPGRIRVEALFRATYGDTEREVAANVEPIVFQGQRLRVHRKVRAAFERVDRRLTEATAKDPKLKPFLQNLAGTFVWRKIAGTEQLSAHSFGVSIDLNVKRSHYWRWQKPPAPLRWQNQIPQAIVDAFEAEGFIWGGRWFHYDTMHFEYRPELLDPTCKP